MKINWGKKLYNKRKRLKSRNIFSQEDINKVLYSIPFAEIIGEYVVLRKTKTDHVGRCPFCRPLTKNNSHFRVSDRKKVYKCFECGESGTSAIKFLMMYHNLPFDKTIRFVNRYYSSVDMILPIRTGSLGKSSSCKDEDLPF